MESCRQRGKLGTVKESLFPRCLVGVRQKKIAAHDLEIGMFVSDLDRPWHQTPFPIQGFYLRSENDLKAVVSHCKWVMIDVAETREEITLGSDKVRPFARRSSAR
ncbi:MAG: DUF3391 domain-containing protein [Pseudomonadales bacterium]|nr:DUF3391 domain-containing protein [Pseudomonadales bacterium]